MRAGPVERTRCLLHPGVIHVGPGVRPGAEEKEEIGARFDGSARSFGGVHDLWSRSVRVRPSFRADHDGVRPFAARCGLPARRFVSRSSMHRQRACHRAVPLDLRWRWSAGSISRHVADRGFVGSWARSCASQRFRYPAPQAHAATVVGGGAERVLDDDDAERSARCARPWERRPERQMLLPIFFLAAVTFAGRFAT